MLEIAHAGSRLTVEPEKKVARIVGPSAEAASQILRKAISAGVPLDIHTATFRTAETDTLILMIRGEHLMRLLETEKKSAASGKQSLKQTILKQMDNKPPKKLVAAGVLVFCAKTRRFLLQVRGAKQAEAGKVGFFGGGTEQGETPIQTACREIKEEAGVTVNPSLLTPLSVYENETYVFHSFLLVVREEFSPHLNKESESYTWTPASGVDDLDTLPSVKFLFAHDAKLRQITAAKSDPNIDFERVVEDIIGG